MSLGGKNLTEEEIRNYLAAMGSTPAANAMPMPYVDPTLAAQQAILARPMRPSYTGQQLMSREVPLGIQGNNGMAYPSMSQSGLLNAPSYTSRYAGSSGGSDSGSAMPSEWDNMTDAQHAAYYAANPNMAAVTRFGQKALSYTTPGLLMGLLAPERVANSAIIASGYTPETYTSETGMGMGSKAGGTSYSNPQTIGIQDYANFGQVQSNNGMLSDSPTGGSIGETGMGVNAAGQTVSNDATIAAQDAANFGESAGSSSESSSKIVCTAMNQQYGFGSFRNAIWLKYAENNLTKAHEAGYHAIFLPLVDFGFKQGDGKVNLMVRKFLESCARHRSLDLRAEMRGTKRDPIGRAYRFVLEPLCYAVGKFKGY